MGAPRNAGGGDSRGHVRIFRWSGSAWVQLGADIDGEGANDRFGRSISLNTAGANPFTLTCSNSAGVSTSRSVSTNVIGNSQGVVTGSSYISSSNVFLDINSNFNLDDNPEE